MRAKVAIENITKEKQAIIVSEIPYQVNKIEVDRADRGALPREGD